MTLLKTAMLLGLALLTAACQSTTMPPSEARYQTSEVMQSATVERCRVIDARQVFIGAENPGARNAYARAAGQPEEQIGAALGGILGAALASQLGGNNRQAAMAVGLAIGATAGRAQGTRMAQTRMTRPGIEYSILSAGGREEVIVQHMNPGDRIVPIGSTCRITSSAAGKRVLPGDHLPARIATPSQTRFY